VFHQEWLVAWVVGLEVQMVDSAATQVGSAAARQALAVRQQAGLEPVRVDLVLQHHPQALAEAVLEAHLAQLQRQRQASAMGLVVHQQRNQ
jgi:hypothetical protein